MSRGIRCLTQPGQPRQPTFKPLSTALLALVCSVEVFVVSDVALSRADSVAGTISPSGDVPDTHEGVFAPCRSVEEENKRFTRELVGAGFGWGGRVPSWISDVCPQVVAHFNTFPYFQTQRDNVPISSTLFAAHGACTMLVAARMAEVVGARMHLCCGSLLGALVHGGPVPWDDDIDATLSHEQGRDFAALCTKSHVVHNASRAVAKCVVAHNAIKLNLGRE
jgi:hypothetical protein